MPVIRLSDGGWLVDAVTLIEKYLPLPQLASMPKRYPDYLNEAQLITSVY
jgi:hypothetical protein